jgi:vancomycin permeability regulator SanA
MLWTLAGIAVFGGACALAANGTIFLAARGRIFARADDAPARPVAIVFGGRVWRSGQPSRLLADRLDVGIELYKAGRVTKLLLSGDHGRTEYDEVNAMLEYVAERGVPREDVFLDHAGFRTYDTLYRARDIFGVRSAVLVTNAFHLPRAIYTGRRFGLDVVGVPTDARRYGSRVRNHCREFLARVLAWTDVNVTHPGPRHLGDPVDISGDGRVTHDRYGHADAAP